MPRPNLTLTFTRWRDCKKWATSACGRGVIFGECLGAILDTAIEITGAAKGNIQLLDRASHTLCIGASRGFGEPFLKFFEHVSEDSSACGTAMLSHERAIVEDVTQSTIFADKPSLDILLDSGVRAVQSTPLVSSSGKILGMVSTHFSQPHRPSERELRFLDLLVRQVADYLERKETESRLLEQARLLNESHDAILVLDNEDRITYWNKGAIEVYGYDGDEALGRVAHELLRTVFPEPVDHITEKVRRTASWFGELIHTRKDGSKLTVSSRWVLSQTERPSILEINRDVTDLKQKEAELRESRQELEHRVQERTRQFVEANKHSSTLSGRVLQAQDDERRRLARELHDSVGQLLAALAMNISQLEAIVPAAEPDRSVLAESQTLVQQLIQEIRTTSYLLHPPLLEESGLPSALRMYVDGLAQRSGIEIDLSVSENFGRLSQNAELTIFRVIQECLTNIHRHSGSKTASIRLAREPDIIFLEIRDQGQGIDFETLTKIQSGGGGVGIAGMLQRIRNFGRTIKIDSNSGGTTIVLTLPQTHIAAPEAEQAVQRTRAL
jgi:PAS domain S-box-containing protein